MQYLHLVYIAEQQRGALTGREEKAPVKTRFRALDTSRDQHAPPAVPPDDDNMFFTDGPYIETKEYLAGCRNC